MHFSVAFWVHDLSPFILKFPENPLGIDGIRYYGLAYLLGFFGAWLLLRIYDKTGRFKINEDNRATLMTAIIAGVILGGRIGYMLLYDFENFRENPLSLLRVDKGGMASHGGFLGVFVAVAWFANKKKYALLQLGDIIVTIAPLGLFLGRIANFINGELWGKASLIAWAVIFPNSPSIYHPSSGFFGPEPRHPSQIYQATLEGLIPLIYIQWRFWKSKLPAGQLAGEFLALYSIARIIGELFREPDAALIAGMSKGQFYSTFLLLAGIGLILIAQFRSSK